MTYFEFELFVFFCVFFSAFVFPIWAVIMLVTGNLKLEDDDEDLRN